VLYLALRIQAGMRKKCHHRWWTFQRAGRESGFLLVVDIEAYRPMQILFYKKQLEDQQHLMRFVYDATVRASFRKPGESVRTDF
jgi:hypothetical protein